jgi:hypothetical protein
MAMAAVALHNKYPDAGGRLTLLPIFPVAHSKPRRNGRVCPRREYRQEVPRIFNTSKTFGFTTLMGRPAA